MRHPIAVGIVGYGYWGPNLARNLNKMAQVELSAVCDHDVDRRRHFEKLHRGRPAFEDFTEMIREVDLDAVVIATPLKSHYLLAKAALLSGKHVLVEKPMAASRVECEELIELARKNNLTLMVGHTYLYSDAVRKIVELVATGDIGEIRYINCQRLNLGIFKQDFNVAWDLATHDLSIILHILGSMPESVNCQGNAHINPDVEDVTNMSLTFHDGRFATVQSSWLEPRKVRQMTFVGTRKMIVFDDLQPLEKIRIYDVRVDCPPHYDSFAEFHYSYHYGDCYIPQIEQTEPLLQMCRHFADCVERGQDPVSSGHNGLQVVRILEAAEASLQSNGSPVTLNEVKIVNLPTAMHEMSEAG
jgi:predicted dehydrogenase